MRLWIYLALMALLPAAAMAEVDKETAQRYLKLIYPNYSIEETLESITTNRQFIQQTKVELHSDNLVDAWRLGTVHQSVFIGLLERAEKGELKGFTKKQVTVDQQKKTPYDGLRLTFTDEQDRPVGPIRIFDGKIYDSQNRVIGQDTNRYLEYWLFSIAPEARHKSMALRVLPITSFEHCKILDNFVVNTLPRQCLLQNGQIYLEVDENVTAETLLVENFDQCMKYGKAVIDTFPRRCLMPGGRVFTEPPKLPPELEELSQNELEEF